MIGHGIRTEDFSVNLMTAGKGKKTLLSGCSKPGIHFPDLGKHGFKELPALEEFIFAIAGFRMGQACQVNDFIE